ncbi:peptidylprolyl isomerase [Flavobacterium sp.]|jgi:peptidyl-prolyl cis-trans isomerase SurA|uniref:peptidylprolyl isomerase n=1 Tax=Flavobacterium sp. TaxID=239 RepID=UPI002A82CE79|nr:peptidylprolyl isomerase [Flavobacterium sp.]
MRYLFQFLVLVTFIQNGFSQEKKALFTIDSTSYYSDEFIRVYNKNLDLVKDDSQKDLDKYLELFVGYKLKVQKAYKLGLHYNVRYQNELMSYRGQLAKNYINDSKVTNELVEEAYERINKEVKASHILILVDESASPEDTLRAYNKVVKVQQLLKEGKNFEEIADQYSEDPSVKENKGNLGYFSAFRMVYPFENAAFNTSVGDFSAPFRTKFGYHIVKVTDARKNRGEVTVAHIMIVKPSTPDAALQEKTKQTIEEIYQKIKQGENFESLANQFSEDKSTSGKGGVLQRFGSGQLASEKFEEIAFSLNDKNEVSKPFQSQFGWHIVKLIEKHPVQSIQEMRTELESKVRKDERSLLITNSLAAKLRKKYSFTKNGKLFLKIKKSVTDDFYSQTWEMPENKKELSGELVVLNKDKKLYSPSFINYIFSQQKSNIKIKPINALIDHLFEKWMDDQLIKYYDDNLENEFVEFKNIVEEYRDGLLLFDLMEKEIWERAKTDTIGLNAYFKNNSKNYMWNNRYDIDVYSSTDEKVIGKAKSYLEKNKSIDYIKSKLNKNGAINVMVKSGLFEENYDILSEYKNLQQGATSIVKKGNYYFVLKVKEVKPTQEKTIDECRGKVISDYQQYLENNWVDDLKKEFKVNVNQKVFEMVKNQILK